jgi:4-hydroxybenzoate polyprenyltransferase
MGVAGVLSIAYFIPIFGKKLREYVLFKSILIAFIWSVLVVVLPITHEGISVNNATITIFLTRFFFILGLTIPFDIRDMDWDHRNGVSTTPLSYGIKKTKILAIASILVACFIDLLLFFKNMFSAKALVANVLIYTITVFSIFLIKNKKHDYYYRLWLDGLLIMQSAVLLLCT